MNNSAMWRAWDRDWERVLATQPGYVPVSQRKKQTVTSVRTEPYGNDGLAAQGWTKSGEPFWDDDRELKQQWFRVDPI